MNVVRHFPLDDPRRQYAQGYADQERIARIHRWNAAFRAWEPLLLLAGVLGLFWVCLKAGPALWAALDAFLGAFGAAL